jgi:hypothetical protein
LIQREGVLKYLAILVLAVLLGAVVFGCGHADSDSGTVTDTDTDIDSDTDTDTDTDTDAEAPPMEGCDGGYLDPATNLCWQDPAEKTIEWFWASGYCNDGTWGGHDDWRLPDINELISLIRGCVDGTATGDLSTSNCGVEDPGCLESICSDGTDCAHCGSYGGPGSGGCYWDPALSGSCGVSYWSSSRLPNLEHAWCGFFNGGNVYPEDSDYGWNRHVRCVRSEP